jgi:hypothetical protein
VTGPDLAGACTQAASVWHDHVTLRRYLELMIPRSDRVTCAKALGCSSFGGRCASGWRCALPVSDLTRSMPAEASRRAASPLALESLRVRLFLGPGPAGRESRATPQSPRTVTGQPATEDTGDEL